MTKKYNRRMFWCKVCGKITTTTNDYIYKIKLCKEHRIITPKGKLIKLNKV